MIVIKHRTCRDIILLRLPESSLEGVQLAEAYLAHAEMAGQRCKGASFRGANLTAADLSQADLREVDFHGAKLRRSDLRGADLRGATLLEADLCAANLEGADLRGADLSHAVLFDANLASVSYDDDTRWPEGGAFIPPPASKSGWLVAREVWDTARTRLSSSWASVQAAQVPESWRARAHFSAGALAATAVTAAVLGGVIGAQITLGRADLRTVVVRSVPIAPAPEPLPRTRPTRQAKVRPSPRVAPAPRVALAPRGRRPQRARLIVARKPLPRRNPVRVARLSSPRRHLTLRVHSRQRRHTHFALRPRLHHGTQPQRLLARARPVSGARRATEDQRAHTVAWSPSTERTDRSPIRLAVYTPSEETRPRLAARQSAEPASSELILMPQRKVRKRRKAAGVRYAWGNSAFHYGSGYDIYRMNTHAGGANGDAAEDR